MSAECESRAMGGVRKNIKKKIRAPPIARDSRTALASCLPLLD